MKTLLLIDGNAIMHRAYFALPSFLSKKGIPTNAVHGFFSMLYRAIADFAPTNVMIAFDTPKPTFRKKLLKEYQAQRPKLKDDFIQQIPIIHELIDAAGIVRIEKEGYEADDVIGTVARRCEANSIRVFILTGDRDILQLVTENVFVITPLIGLSKIAVYNIEEVEKKFGIKPIQIIDLKALIGDASDNYFGAKGIGPKTAVKLINKYQSIENLLLHLNEIDERSRKIIELYRDNVILSKKLATIVCDVDVPIDLDKTTFNGFHEKMKKRLEELEMNSLAKRFFEKSLPTPKQEKPEKKKEKTSPDQIGLF